MTDFHPDEQIFDYVDFESCHDAKRCFDAILPEIARSAISVFDLNQFGEIID